MKARTPEGIVLCQVRDYLRMLGWFVVRHQQGLGSHAGLADLTAIKGGRTVWIECKAPAHVGRKGQQVKAGKLSPAQGEFMHQLVTHGGEYCIAYSPDDVLEFLKV